MQFCRWSYFLLKYFAGGPLFNPNLHTILQVICFSVRTFCRWSTFPSKLAHGFAGGLIFHPNSPNDFVTGLIFTSKLTYDLAGRLKRQLHNALVVVRGSQMEDGENVLPPRLNAGCLRVHHLRHAPHHHITDCWRSGKKNEDLKLKSSLPVPHALHHLITDYRRHGKGREKNESKKKIHHLHITSVGE